MHYEILEKLSKKPSFRFHVRRVLNDLELNLNAPYSEIIEWLSEWHESEHNLFRTLTLYRKNEGRLYEFNSPCLVKKFRNKYTMLFTSVFGRVYVDDEFIQIPSYEFGNKNNFTCMNFVRCLYENFEGTNKIMNKILKEKNLLDFIYEFYYNNFREETIDYPLAIFKE